MILTGKKNLSWINIYAVFVPIFVVANHFLKTKNMKTSQISLIVFMIYLVVGCSNDTTNDVSEMELPFENQIDNKDYIINSDTAVFYGELIYVPIYSKIFHQDDKKTIELASTLSIHNTDPDNYILIKKVYYHNLKGELIKKYIDSPVVLNPLETKNIVVGEKDQTGGTGANFIVEWDSNQQVSSPIVEAIMITTQMNQGISFTTSGKIIRKFGNSLID